MALKAFMLRKKITDARKKLDALREKDAEFETRKAELTLHIRRRRYLDADDKSVILSEFPIKADGTSISPEFADFLKRRS